VQGGLVLCNPQTRKERGVKRFPLLGGSSYVEYAKQEAKQ